METRINIPNLLSGLRIGLIPFIFLLILNSNKKNFFLLIGLFLFTILLDFADGYLARKLHQETELGKILDPVADKLMIIVIILALIIRSDFPVWLGVLIFLRDCSILLASFRLMKEVKRVKSSVLIGKITFAFLGALILIYILDLHPEINLEEMKRFFIVVCTGFLIWSFITYYDIFKQVKRDER